MALINCPECNKEISDKVQACPHCGYPFEGTGNVISTVNTKNKENETVKSNKIIITVALIIVLIIGLYAYNNVLWGVDKAAYDILVECGNNFKDPSSLRIIKGFVTDDKRALFVKTSAENSFGASNSEYYFFTINGEMLEDDSGIVEDADTNFNIRKVNKAYSKLWD